MESYPRPSGNDGSSKSKKLLRFLRQAYQAFTKPDAEEEELYAPETPAAPDHTYRQRRDAAQARLDKLRPLRETPPSPADALGVPFPSLLGVGANIEYSRGVIQNLLGALFKKQTKDMQQDWFVASRPGIPSREAIFNKLYLSPTEGQQNNLYKLITHWNAVGQTEQLTLLERAAREVEEEHTSLVMQQRLSRRIHDQSPSLDQTL